MLLEILLERSAYGGRSDLNVLWNRRSSVGREDSRRLIPLSNKYSPNGGPPFATDHQGVRLTPSRPLLTPHKWLVYRENVGV
jgi:hypothetical protein